VSFGQDPGSFLQGATTCPHCGGIAKASPHHELRFVCDLCGAPRIEVKGKPVELTSTERRGLEAARKAQKSRAGWRFGGIFAGLSSAFLFAIYTLIALIFGLSLGLVVTAGITAGPMVLLLLVALSRVKNKTGEIQKALDQAWTGAARQLVLASKNGIAVPDLAERLGMTEADAERIAAQLTVDNQVSSRVSDDGRLVLEGTTGIRIDADEGGSPMADPLEARFAELERQQAEEDAAPANRKLKAP
jgi:hypothetical protein